MFGLLNVDKPQGATSRDIVSRVQRLVRPCKVGHAGTLDPLATGVLVLCVGPATRLIEYVQRMRKRYVGTFLLGKQSDTEDILGDVIPLASAVRPKASQIEAAIPHFIGTIMQRPPSYSALKVNGRRAYDLARQGISVQLQPRSIEVHAIGLLEYEYPDLKLEIECGSGTYIRSLGRDLARSLNTSAVMSSLRRTAVGPFRVENACQPEDVRATSIERHLEQPLRALTGLPVVTLADVEVCQIKQGQSIHNRFQSTAPEVAAVDASGELVAILVSHSQRHLRPIKNLVSTQLPPLDTL